MDQKKRSYIKDMNHVNLDTVISQLRTSEFYGKMEIYFEKGRPIRTILTESIKLSEKEFQEKKATVPVK